MNAAIAQHLNVSASAIVRIEEWANVIFCVVKGLGARFVSKNVVKMNKTAKECKSDLQSLEDSLPVDVCAWTDNQRDEWHRLNNALSAARKREKQTKAKEKTGYEHLSHEELMSLH